jgi:hypothetical protein
MGSAGLFEGAKKDATSFDARRQEMICRNPKTRVRRWCAFLGVVAALLSLFSAAQTPGFAVVDFQRYFPQFLAVSEEVQTKEFPQGVQYKFLSIWDDEQQLAYVMLIRRDGANHVLRVLFHKGPLEESEAALRETVNNLSKKVGSVPEIIDLRGIRTHEEFHARAVSLGWGIEILK